MKKKVNKVIKKEQKRTTYKKALFLKAFEKHPEYIYKTCKLVDIEYKSYNEWRKSDFEFDEACQKIQDSALETNIEFGESALKKQVDKGNIAAIIFYLVNISNGKWKQTQNIEHKGNINIAGLADVLKAAADKKDGIKNE